MSFDDVLTDIGGFGIFQWKIITLVTIPPLAQCAILLSQVFIAGDGNHWCKVSQWQQEDCWQWNMTMEQCSDFKKTLSIPMNDDGTWSQCSKFNVSGMDLATAFEHRNWTGGEVISCDEGWEFDRSVFHSTIGEEWELVCEKAAIPNLIQSVYFFGYLVGSIAFGRLADRIGRHYTFMLGCTASGVFGILTSLSPNVIVFTALRFITAAASYGTTLMCFVIASEIVIPSQRVYTGVVMWMLFSVGYFFLSGTAFITYSWRILVAIIAIPYLAMIAAFPFLTESPRWLLSRDKGESAEKIIRKIARENKKELKEDVLGKLKRGDGNSLPAKSGKLLDLIRVPTMRWYMISMCYSWFVQGFVYFGLTLGTSNLGINVYFAFCLSGVMDIAAHFLSIFTMKTCGRRWSASFLMLLAGISCFGSVIAPLGPWRVAVATIGKLAIAISFDIVYVYAGEILPTPLRAVGVGVCSVAARIGGIVAPLLLYLGTIFESLPVILFATSSIIGGFLILILPETSNQPLPDTIEDTVNRKRAKKLKTSEKQEYTEIKRTEDTTV
ncbi:organic cation transporter protein-like [Apostichopus japonicus]|uniref:organic cation transporter protein-like n=1 Tax=Stichopus japonicus TaxID=307972 RepID=UPI003AB1FE8A